MTAAWELESWKGLRIGSKEPAKSSELATTLEESKLWQIYRLGAPRDAAAERSVGRATNTSLPRSSGMAICTWYSRSANDRDEGMRYDMGIVRASAVLIISSMISM